MTLERIGAYFKRSCSKVFYESELWEQVRREQAPLKVQDEWSSSEESSASQNAFQRNNSPSYKSQDSGFSDYGDLPVKPRGSPTGSDDSGGPLSRRSLSLTGWDGQNWEKFKLWEGPSCVDDSILECPLEHKTFNPSFMSSTTGGQVLGVDKVIVSHSNDCLDNDKRMVRFDLAKDKVYVLPNFKVPPEPRTPGKGYIFRKNSMRLLSFKKLRKGDLKKWRTKSSECPARHDGPPCVDTPVLMPEKPIRRDRSILHSQKERSPVRQWLEDLTSLCEPECFHMLQSKSLASDINRMVILTARNLRDSVRNMVRRAQHIAKQFKSIMNNNEHEFHLRLEIIQLIRELIKDYSRADDSSRNGHPHPELFLSELRAQEDEILLLCDQFYANGAKYQHLMQCFTKLVTSMLSRKIQLLLSIIERQESDLCLKAGLSSISILGSEGGHMCRLLVSQGAVRSLLTICVEQKALHTQVLALRGLATICCVVEGITELTQAGGLEILCDILNDKNSGEAEKSEVAGVLAQITSPWIQKNHSIPGLSNYLDKMVPKLTDLCSTTNSSETFLLVTAALANLTFMEPGSLVTISHFNTLRIIIKALQCHGDASVFTQDQVATILANMAASPECRDEIIESGGIVVLLRYLHIRSSPNDNVAEVSACERVIEKSAIALSRLCTEAKALTQLTDFNGIQTLGMLCRDFKSHPKCHSAVQASMAVVDKISQQSWKKPSARNTFPPESYV